MARLKQNEEDCTTELYIDGKFVAGWNQITLTDLQERIVCNMIEKAVFVGEHKKAAEIRKALEC
jgi:hypothetical protein